MNVMTTTVMLVAFTIGIASCKNNNPPIQNKVSENAETQTRKMKITAGNKVFTATLYETAAATAFEAMLPMTIKMEELNGNEKFTYFDTQLPVDATNGGNISAGDLMLYGDNCLVLFYESLNTSYSYTRLGKIDDSSGLVTALGSGSVSVKFELE